LQEAFRSVYELYQDSVVFITTEEYVRVAPSGDSLFAWLFGGQVRRQVQMGTGFIIRPDGYICTNHHVIAGKNRILVKVAGKAYQARIIGSNRELDIALLKIQGDGFKSVHFGNSDETRVGDWAIAIGNPFGLDRTFTVGVVSAIGRDVGDRQSYIQTDASINPGNSGGPLINLDGEVIGMNRMIYSQTGSSAGIGFAIPINIIRRILERYL
jgi:serine protease Do